MEFSKLTGTVDWFSPRKGYGFIKPEDEGEDVYVHFTGIDMEGYKQLKEGDYVEYSLQDSTRKPGRAEAVEVKILKAAEATEATEAKDAPERE